ncbi:unnamed protein product [Scytosiphon promiscuus]
MEELNKSCDQCGRKKRKCSGEKPCARCVQSREVCSYSKRRPRTPSAQLAAVRARGPASHSLLQGHATPTLKRARLRASPATGLLGMEENVFLCDFFGSIGFMPFTTQSDIRTTMIKIILPSTLQQSAMNHECGEEEELNTIIPGGKFGNAMGPADPSACTFWCAVGIGALAKGRPIASVTNYLRLASNALANFSGQPDKEMAKAWSILSYLYGLMGNEEKFHVYLELAHDFLRDAVEKGTVDTLPVGLAEIIRMGDTVKLFHEDVQLEGMKSLLNQEFPRPELGELATAGELCRHLFQSARVFEQTILTGILCRRKRTVSYEDLGEAEPTDTDVGAAFERATAEEISGAISPLLVPRRPAELVPNVLSSAAFSRMLTMLEFRRLEEAVESPSVGSGVGGLVINDRLMYEKAARGDTRGTLDRVERCAVIYERYPGLNRFCMGAHKTHIMLIMLVALANPRAKELYNRLRAAYNLSPPPGYVKVPCWEEWRGVTAFCDKEGCRSVEALLAREDVSSAFPSPSLIRGTCTDEEQLEVEEYTNSKQEAEGNISASFEFEVPAAVVGGSSDAGQAGPTMSYSASLPYVGAQPPRVGDSQRNVWRGCVSPHGEETRLVSPDRFPYAAEPPMLSMVPIQDSNSEAGEEGLAAEDWLDAVEAIDLSDIDAGPSCDSI